MSSRAAFIVDGVRTPIGRYGGVLAAVRPDDLASHAVAALLARHPDLDPAVIDDVLLGCANQAGEDNRNVARMAALLAGLPDSVPGTTINRLCGSGLDAVALGRSFDHCRGQRGGGRGRGRVDVAGAFRHAEGRYGVQPERGDLRHHDRLAVREPGAEAAVRDRLDAARPRRTWRPSSGSAGRTRTRSRCAASSAPRRRSRTAGWPRRSCRSTMPRRKRRPRQSSTSTSTRARPRWRPWPG